MVDYDTFLKWATEHFGAENIRFRNNEICTHSVFTDDHKFHLWMNPSGGKKERSGGVFRCWKTDKMGSLISLVSQIDKIPYEEAEERLCGCSSLRMLEKKLDEFFGTKSEDDYQNPHPQGDAVINPDLDLPPHTYLIDDLARTNAYKSRAVAYLDKRKIPTDGLYVCLAGDYKNRIIIPYYDQYGDLIYYNARTMDTSPKTLRYMKPKVPGVEQNNLLYMPAWPKAGTKVFITEGEFDAMSLNICGLHGVAVGGKFLSDAQIELLRLYVPVVATDSDEAGTTALVNIGNELLGRGFPEVYYVRPPKGFKDWNKVLEEKNPSLMKAYIDKYIKPYTQWTADVLAAKNL